MNDVAKTRPASAYVDDPKLTEIFGDMVSSVGFDGANFRIEMAVTRMVPRSGGKESTIHPVARIVVPLNAANDLIQKLSGALADMEKQGVLRRSTRSSQ